MIGGIEMEHGKEKNRDGSAWDKTEKRNAEIVAQVSDGVRGARFREIIEKNMMYFPGRTRHAVYMKINRLRFAKAELLSEPKSKKEKSVKYAGEKTLIEVLNILSRNRDDSKVFEQLMDDAKVIISGIYEDLSKYKIKEVENRAKIELMTPAYEASLNMAVERDCERMREIREVSQKEREQAAAITNGG
jgi:hypothetical protein